jgi:hypothetical protein
MGGGADPRPEGVKVDLDPRRIQGGKGEGLARNPWPVDR